MTKALARQKGVSLPRRSSVCRLVDSYVEHTIQLISGCRHVQGADAAASKAPLLSIDAKSAANEGAKRLKPTSASKPKASAKRGAAGGGGSGAKDKAVPRYSPRQRKPVVRLDPVIHEMINKIDKTTR